MKKKIILIVVAVLLIISLVVGMSYAYWRHTFVTTSINKINSSCFSMELTNEKNNIVLESTYPISDEKGKSLTPYSFTITNTCDLFASYTINLEMLSGTTLDSKYIKTMINNEAITNLSTLETTTTTIDGAIESRVLFKGSLGSGDSTDYTFRLWMDYDTPNNEESMNKNFQSKITVTSEVSTYSPVESGFNKLAEALLVNEYQTTNVDVAKNKIASKQEVDFSKTAPLITWEQKIETTTSSVKTTKPAPSTIGTYGIVENATKILMGTSYIYNSEKGSYALTDTAYYDPTTLDYENNTYYFCGSTTTLTENNTVSYWDGTSCANLKKIVAISKIESDQSVFPSGDLLDVKIYTMKYITHWSSELESDKSDKGLYESVDDHGTTYYYRGNVTNNIVKYAGFYWKVVRINGDGSVRLLYSGDDPTKYSSSTAIGKSQYNTERADQTYAGYMYSNTIDTSYLDTIRNDNDSAIKITLDNWYKENILDKGYANVVADAGFCNDRSLAYSNHNGYKDNESTTYSGGYRVSQSKPTLICPNADNDLFTLANNTKGNKKLTYPIGLLIVDELLMAGTVNGYLNNLVYTKFPASFWTMTPINYNVTSTTIRVWEGQSSGRLEYGNVTGSTYVRPVINLKGDTEISGGIGTPNDPFIVK